MKGPGASRQQRVKSKHGLKSLKKLVPYLKPLIVPLLLAMFFAIIGTILNVSGPYFIARLIKQITDQLHVGVDITELTIRAVVLLGIYLLSAFLLYISAYLVTGITQDLSYRLRKDISGKINRLPLRYFDSRSIGDVLSRVTNDVDMISHNLNQSLNSVIVSLTTIGGILVFMFIMSWHLTIVALVTVPLSVLAMLVVVRFSQKYFFRQQKVLGELNGHIEEMYSSHQIIKAFNSEERSINKFDIINDDLHESSWKSQFISSIMMPLIRFIGNLGYVAVIVFGALLSFTGVFGVEVISGFLLYIRRFNQPMNQIAEIANVLQSAAAATERIMEFLEEEEMENEDHITNYLDPKTIRGEVEFKNVKFGYKEDTLVIKDFNSHVVPGQTVAIVGPTGAGKTTLINLLMRFYETTSGDIFIDGVNTKDLTRRNVRELFGMVLQDTWLFEGTIRDNLKYSNPHATDEEMIEACKATHVHHLIQSMPGGYNMMLDETANIAGGQKQLLTIARAMIENAPMLILDEATSNVDTRTEVLIQQAMDQLMVGRTSFVIAHRLSTIKDADMILVIKEGNIIEQGNHESLLAKNGFYAELYNSQFSKGELFDEVG